jgi:hypothetical protein
MKMFSDCSGECNDCFIYYVGGCLAGHGDDDFIPITKQEAVKLITENKINEDNVERLKEKFKI